MTITSEANNYVVAIEMKHGMQPLNTGKTYSMADALTRAKELNDTCEAELKALGGNKFVAYSLVFDTM